MIRFYPDNDNFNDRTLARCVSGVLTLALIALAPFFAQSASAISLTLSQIGGTAEGGRGVVGDTVRVAVDLVVGEDEVLTGAFPILGWDEEGGNVLDIISAVKGPGGFLGSFPLRSVAPGFILHDSKAWTGRIDRYFDDGSNFSDSSLGATYLNGLNLFYPDIGDDELSYEYINNGAPGPANLRVGEATFRLAAPGLTTIVFARDPEAAVSTAVLGARDIQVLINDQVEFNDLPFEAIGFGALQILVVPEPSTVILLGLSLAMLAAQKRSS